MTVKELIKAFEEFLGEHLDQDAPVYFNDGEFGPIEVSDICLEKHPRRKKGPKIVVFLI